MVNYCRQFVVHISDFKPSDYSKESQKRHTTEVRVTRLKTKIPKNLIKFKKGFSGTKTNEEY